MIYFMQKIATLQMVNQEQEHTIIEMNGVTTTPRKLMNMSHGNIVVGTPKTPKTPKKYPGKENQQPSVVHSPSVLRTRIN